MKEGYFNGKTKRRKSKESETLKYEVTQEFGIY
jgi:hypothetical protein